jgi:ABC-2 type transport system permease protein
MLKERIKKIYFSRNILWDMSKKQLRLKYVGSRLGIWWAVVTPLVLAASINFVFTKALNVNMPNYTFFILSGLMPWLFFSASLTEATNSFITQVSISRQAVFPREFMPFSTVLANFINFLIGLIFLIPLFIILDPKILWFLLFLFPIMMLHLIFVLGLGILFSLVNVFFRDLSHFLSIAFMIWFWITPIFYSLDALSSPYREICMLNPMSYYVILYQAVLFKAKVPPASLMLTASLISLSTFIIGYILFIKKESVLLKRI